MAAKDWSREIAAVSPYIQGVSVQVQGTCPQQIPGVQQVVDNSVTGLASLADATIDTVVSIGGLEASTDPIAFLRTLRRGVREGGKLVLVVQDPSVSSVEPGQNQYAPQYLSSLIVLVSGFKIETIEEVVTDQTYIIVCERCALSEVRQPFGVHGPTVVQQVTAGAEARSEYYFQIGTLMLQTGDPELAVQCFEKVLVQEPNNPEAYFGLGMTYGTQSRWAEALEVLQRAAALDPNSEEVRRWIDLARQQMTATTTIPAAPQQGIPQVAPVPGGTSAPAPVSPRGASVASAPTGAGTGFGAASPAVPTQAPRTASGSLRI